MSLQEVLRIASQFLYSPLVDSLSKHSPQWLFQTFATLCKTMNPLQINLSTSLRKWGHHLWVFSTSFLFTSKEYSLLLPLILQVLLIWFQFPLDMTIRKSPMTHISNCLPATTTWKATCWPLILTHPRPYTDGLISVHSITILQDHPNSKLYGQLDLLSFHRSQLPSQLVSRSCHYTQKALYNGPCEAVKIMHR